MFKPSNDKPDMPLTLLGQTTQIATVAAGCFWGVEHIIRQHFGHGKGLIDAKVGYTGGVTENPSYREVCGSKTQHAEAVQLIFDPKIVGYETLIDFFFRIHDPTTANRQGPDVGSQYRSAIFTFNSEQDKIAHQVKDRMEKEFWKKPIVTEISSMGPWWDAEDYHQKYLVNNPGGYECPTHYVRTKM